MVGSVWCSEKRVKYKIIKGSKMATATTVNIMRNSVNEPWGMKIAGGRDFRMQLQVKKVGAFSIG